MTSRLKLGAVLIAILALALMPAAAFASTNHARHSDAAFNHALRWVFGIGLSVAGTVTVTYSSFAADNPTPQFGTAYTGGTVAPTAVQSAQVNRINATVSFTDTDTTITITHNWGMSAAQAAALEPDLIVYDTALGSSNTTPSGITWSVSNTNSVVGTKANVAGSGRTISVTLRRPATPGN